MPGDDERDKMLERLAAGDPAAAQELFERFSRRLVRLARSRLSERLRAKVDPEDLVQSAFRSFIKRQSLRRFDFANWEDVWSLLVVFTLRKLTRQVDIYKSAGRSLDREHPLDGDLDSYRAIARDPQPEEAAILADLVEQVSLKLDTQERNVFLLKLEGRTNLEIATTVGVGERTIYRILDTLRDRLASLMDEEPA